MQLVRSTMKFELSVDITPKNVGAIRLNAISKGDAYHCFPTFHSFSGYDTPLRNGILNMMHQNTSNFKVVYSVPLKKSLSGDL